MAVNGCRPIIEILRYHWFGNVNYYSQFDVTINFNFYFRSSSIGVPVDGLPSVHHGQDSDRNPVSFTLVSVCPCNIMLNKADCNADVTWLLCCLNIP